MARKRKPDPYLIDDENPEATAEDIARSRPAREMLPKSFFDMLEERRRAKAAAEPKRSRREKK